MKGKPFLLLAMSILAPIQFTSATWGMGEQWIGVQIEAGNFEAEIGTDSAALRVE